MQFENVMNKLKFLIAWASAAAAAAVDFRYRQEIEVDLTYNHCGQQVKMRSTYKKSGLTYHHHHPQS